MEPEEIAQGDLFKHLVILHCEMMVGAHEIAYIRLPVSIEQWETGSESMRTDFRNMARRELGYTIEQRTGIRLSRERLAQLDVWAEYPNACTVECIGGPLGGERIKISSRRPPVRISLPVKTVLTAVLGEVTASPSQVAHYECILNDLGRPSHTADDAWRYGWRP